MTSRVQMDASSRRVRTVAAASAVAAATLRLNAARGSVATTGVRAGAARAGTGSSIHSRRRTRGCQARALRQEPRKIRAKMSAPATMMSQLAIAKRWSTNQPPTPPSKSPMVVLRIWSAPQAAEALSSRALGSVMLVTPMRHTVTSAIHRITSTGLGIDLLTGGTKVAATIPVKRAIENCSSSGTSTPKERASHHEYWRRRRRRSVLNARRHVHISFPVRCLDGVDADPLGVHALDSRTLLAKIDGSTPDHPADHDRALRESRAVRPALERRRLRPRRGRVGRFVVAGRHLRAQLCRRAALAAWPAGPGRHVRQRAGRRARDPVEPAGSTV